MASQAESEEDVTSIMHIEEQAKAESHHRFYRRIGKRFLDVIFATCGLIVFAVPMAFIAILVRLTSPGPAIFCQLRAGRKGKLFVLYKFRSMYTDAPEKSNQEFTVQSMNHYVTRLGRFMRKTSIDELPQMINVLKGEMSFIGPRPLAKTDEYVLELRSRSGADLIRPGISGLAQVNGRNEISDDLKASWDAEYASSYGLFKDVSIVLQTLIEVLMQHGINGKSSKQNNE